MRIFVHCIFGVISSASSLFALCADAADWPQHRYDAGRTAASPQHLPDELHLAWSIQLPTPRPVFPHTPQLNFDASYEPVVKGKTMLVPSMVTDSVTAIDTDTGAVRWRVFADGPVRFAPAVGRDKAYFVSDDGHLYCVAVSDGRILWRFRGLPAGRDDRRVVGDGRLISIFPARGGCVLADGVVYFAAGLWADEGVFVHAVDAKTGRAMWSNTTSDRVSRANNDHFIGAEAGISPQGHLALIGETLVVPCGQQLPALLDARTGRLHTYTMGHGGKHRQPKGSVSVSGVGDYLFHTGDLYDLGNIGGEAPLNDAEVDFVDIRMRMIHPGALTRLQSEPTNTKKNLGAFRKPVLTPEAMYHRDDDDLAAFDLTQCEMRENVRRKSNRFVDAESAVFPELWRLHNAARVHIKAGDKLYCAAPGEVQAVKLPAMNDDEPTIGWRTDVPGEPHRLLAADDKLFVVTQSGAIHAFAERPTPTPAVRQSPQPADTGPGDAKARRLLSEAGVSGGYVVMLGMDDPDLAESLARSPNCHVIVLVAEDQVKTLRRRFYQAGLYGSRIAVLGSAPAGIKLPPYLASLIVVGESTANILAEDHARLATLFERLRPYGGTCVGLDEADLATVDAPGAVIRQASGRTLWVRQGPLLGAADWSHEGANAAHTGASLDRRVRPPLRRLWFNFADRWGKRGSWVRIAGGRMLICEDALQAVDVYTGRTLWRVPHIGAGQTLVAMGDAVYVPGKTCEILDASTGRVVDRWEAPAGAKRGWRNLRVDAGVVVFSSGERLTCLDRATGRVRWTHVRKNSITGLALACDRVFCVDAPNPRRSGLKPALAAGRLTALDLRDGRVLWETPAAGEIHYSESDDVILTGIELGRGEQRDPLFNSNDFLVKTYTAYRGVDGKKLWSDVQASHAFLTGGKIVAYLTHKWPKQAQLIVYDPKSGKKIGDEVEWTQRGCTVLRAGVHLLTGRHLGSAAYCDLDGGAMTTISNVRAACTNNLFFGDGVLAAPNLSDGCFCNYIPVSQALAPATAFE